MLNHHFWYSQREKKRREREKCFLFFYATPSPYISSRIINVFNVPFYPVIITTNGPNLCCFANFENFSRSNIRWNVDLVDGFENRPVEVRVWISVLYSTWLVSSFWSNWISAYGDMYLIKRPEKKEKTSPKRGDSIWMISKIISRIEKRKLKWKTHQIYQTF